MHHELINPNYIPTAPLSVSIKATEQILKQLKNSIFEIKYNNINSTGFLCKIKYDEMSFNALIINYQVIDKKFIENNDILRISLNDNNNTKEINFKIKREIFYSEQLDITIIEIKKEDGFNDNDFLELDDNLLKKDSEIFYKDESIYILQYKDGNMASVSYGLIIEGVGNVITIYSDIGKCSLGSPILNLSTNKVIGICKEFTKDSIDRRGINFKYIMKECFLKNKKEVFKNKNINEIRIALKVEKEDLNKRIYFMYNNSKNNNDNNINDNFNNDFIRRAKSLEIVYYLINDKSIVIYIDEEKKEQKNYYFIPTISKIYTIRITFGEQLVSDCSYMFYNCDKIISIDFSYFNSSNVNNMRYMFHGCVNLRDIDFTNIDTTNVINMERMFYDCMKLNYLDLSNFNTENVIYTDFMFYNSKNLEKIIFSSKFKTTNVINMDYMFSGCIRLKELNLSSFETINATNMTHMFYKCRQLEKLDVSSFNTENVTNMDLMFHGCQKLQNLDLSNFDTKNVTTMGFMFFDCTNLKNLNISKFNTENVRDMEEMFSSCKTLKFLDLSKFNTKNVLYRINYIYKKY